MPALDQCHEQVVRALEKEGWDVHERPFVLPVTRRRRLYIDIHAEQSTRSQAQSIIVVEVKCFPEADSELNDLYTAIGQYVIYRDLLRRRGVDNPLYLAVPVQAYNGVFKQMAMTVVSEIRIKMVVIDMDKEVVERWIE
jgi:hypothetical protein